MEVNMKKKIKHVFAVIIIMAIQGCASQGELLEKLDSVSQNFGSLNYLRNRKSKLKDKNPSEIKKLFGKPAYEGLANVTRKEVKDFVLVYPIIRGIYRKGSILRVNWNIKKRKYCAVITFSKENDYKTPSNFLSNSFKQLLSKDCSPYIRNGYIRNFKELTSKKFEKLSKQYK